MGSFYHLVTGLILTVQILGTALVQAQNTNFSFAYFSTPESFLMIDDVQHYAENFSFLLNSRATSLSSSTCGKLLYKDTVRMKDVSTGVVASFRTAFSFQITGLNTQYANSGYLHGDGMAFTFTRDPSTEAQDAGASLCLLQSSDNGWDSNRLFAVEFDTFLNSYLNDSSDSHIGVNLNSMNSTYSHNLCGDTLRHCSYLCNGGYFTAWIDYDSKLQKLEVRFANGSLFNNIPKPPNPLIEASLSLANYLEDFMYVGFSASTGTYFEVVNMQSWKFTSFGMPESLPVPSSPVVVTNPDSKSHQKSNVGIISGVCAGIVGALLLLLLVIAKYRWRASYTQGKFSLVDQNLVPRMFTYKELSKATKNFSRSELLGSGGFGAVYRGTLPSGALVAVKRMKQESKHGQEGFQAEAASLSQIRHRNLVQLRGWCHDEEQLLLVYDYMCNGSLDEWLYQFPTRRGKGPNLNDVESLPLNHRHSVLSGVAAALAYLHEECVQCVLHRDIKSSNVLLDGDLNAFLGDFGLARLIDHQKMEKTTLMAGTLGYMAPEMPHTGKATKETDVYGFGVLMLEVMSGTQPLDVFAIERGEGILVDRVWRAHEAGNILQAADSRFGTFPPSFTTSDSYGGLKSQDNSIIGVTVENSDLSPSSSIHAPGATSMEDMQTIANLLHVGLLCSNPNPEGRPSMRQVSQLLQSSEYMEMSLPPLPEFKPQNQYSRRGFSELAILSSSSASSVLNVQDAARGLLQSSPPSSQVSAGEPANMQTSFATSSSVLSGR